MLGENVGDGGDDTGCQVTPLSRDTAAVVGVWQDRIQQELMGEV